jgi:AcrR family transcriptional regulator
MAFEPLTQERRRAMTREHLLEAAAIVFARDGFHGSSLDEIAATAGFTKGAVYSNFKSKDDLYLAVLDERINRQFAEIRGVLDTEGLTHEEQLPGIANVIRPQMWDDSWARLFLEFVLYASRNPEARTKLATWTRHSLELVEQQIRNEHSALGATPRYPVRHLAVILVAMFEGLGIYRLIDRALVSEETISTLLRFLYDSMGVDDTGSHTTTPGVDETPSDTAPAGG